VGQEHPLRCFAEPNGPAFWLCDECASNAFLALDHMSYEQMIEDRLVAVRAGHKFNDVPPTESPWRRLPNALLLPTIAHDAPCRAQLHMRSIVSGGATVVLEAADEIVYIDGGRWCARDKRTGLFRPTRIEVTANAASFVIDDIRCGKHSQFANGRDPVPAEIFDPKFMVDGVSDITMDTIMPGEAFVMVVQNVSEHEFEFAATIVGLYLPAR
jgi:hypothetical protein